MVDSYSVLGGVHCETEVGLVVRKVPEGAAHVALEGRCLEERLRVLDALHHSVNVEDAREDGWVNAWVVERVARIEVNGSTCREMLLVLRERKHEHTHEK